MNVFDQLGCMAAHLASEPTANLNDPDACLLMIGRSGAYSPEALRMLADSPKLFDGVLAFAEALRRAPPRKTAP